MQIVIQGCFFALLNTDNETKYYGLCMCLIDAFIPTLNTALWFVIPLLKLRNSHKWRRTLYLSFVFFSRNLLLIHKKLKKDERDFRFSCNLFALATCKLVSVNLHINITWLVVVVFCRLIQLHICRAAAAVLNIFALCECVKYSKKLHGRRAPQVQHLHGKSLEKLAFHFPTWRRGLTSPDALMPQA